MCWFVVLLVILWRNVPVSSCAQKPVESSLLKRITGIMESGSSKLCIEFWDCLLHILKLLNKLIVHQVHPSPALPYSKPHSLFQVILQMAANTKMVTRTPFPWECHLNISVSCKESVRKTVYTSVFYHCPKVLLHWNLYKHLAIYFIYF